MRPGGGKQKGSAFERKICEQLSRWIDPRGSDTHFWRSSMSGGRSTIRFAKGKQANSQAGDICAITRLGHPFLSKFFVECKFVKKLAIQGAILKGVGTLAGYWTVLENEAEKHNRFPILIAKENGSPVMVFMWPHHAPQFFGAVTNYEVARLHRLSDVACGVSCYMLDDLLQPKGYAVHRFTR